VTAIDTSALIDALTGPKRSAAALRRAIEEGERLFLPSLVLYEWLRGPRIPAELLAQEALFPTASAAVFGPREAALSAGIYRSVRRGRDREIDIGIAAVAIVRNAQLWTLNHADFADIPGIRLTTFS
jgi:predicted nucleic acid-binding protein